MVNGIKAGAGQLTSEGPRKVLIKKNAYMPTIVNFRALSILF